LYELRSALALFRIIVLHCDLYLGLYADMIDRQWVYD